MQATLRLTRNTISPSLQMRARALKDTRPLLKTMGEYAVQWTKRSFNEPGLRPSPWPNLASGRPARLRLNQLLARSPRVVSFDNRKVLIGSDRRYAAIHQLGGHTGPRVIRPKKGKALYWPGARHPVKKVNHPGSRIPARPYFPFLKNGRPSPQFRRALQRTMRVRIGQLIRQQR
jgi:phage gpG-like protein